MIEDSAVQPMGAAPHAPLKFPNVWRDPLYGDVRLTQEEARVIDTLEMQRLRGYAQLGLTWVAFEGARHSRLLHSVGCVERVEQILRTIEQTEGVSVGNEVRLAARLYALTHDVTHMSIGHTLEDEYSMFKRHDNNDRRVQRLVLDSSRSELAEVLEESEIGREVRSHFDPDSTVHTRSDIGELVSGPVGADVLDYVDRDSLFLGLDHRVDSALLRQLRLAPDGNLDNEHHLISVAYGSYGLRSDRQYALESLYEQRYALFLKAFTHKTKIKASALLAKALAICTTEGRSVLTEEDLEMAMSDYSMFEMIKRSGRPRAVRLVADLERRRLPKATFRASVMSEAERAADDFGGHYEDHVAKVRERFPDFESRVEAERKLARAARLEYDQVFLYIPPSAPGFKKTQSHRFLLDRHGQPQTPEEPWFRRLRQKHLGLWEAWVFAAEDVDSHGRERLGSAAENLLGVSNQIADHVRQRRLF